MNVLRRAQLAQGIAAHAAQLGFDSSFSYDYESRTLTVEFMDHEEHDLLRSVVQIHERPDSCLECRYLRGGGSIVEITDPVPENIVHTALF